MFLAFQTANSTFQRKNALESAPQAHMMTQIFAEILYATRHALLALGQQITNVSLAILLARVIANSKRPIALASLRVLAILTTMPTYVKPVTAHA